ncbi:MAG: hypothetical protein ACR5K9_04225 [Wolbachia sp.]
MLEVELTALVETGTSKEEDKKAEPKEKEATKEVREDVEIKAKVDEREVPKIIAPISLFDFSSGFAKPIPLTKPEFDLLREPIRNIVIDSSLKVVISNKDSEVKAVQENKQAKPEAPKVAMHSPSSKQPVTNTAVIRQNQSFLFSNKDNRRDTNTVNDVNEKGTPTNESTDKQENDLYAEFAKEMAQAKSQSNFPQRVQSEVTDVGVSNLKNQSAGKNVETSGLSR